MTHPPELAKLLLEKQKRVQENKLVFAFPEEDIQLLDGTIIYNRHLYPKHLEFLEAGNEYFERAFIAANRVGKTRTGIYEILVHATGLYPTWWKGRRFTTPITLWICGDRGETIRDSVQQQILELLPKDLLIKKSSMSGIANAIGQYYIKHVHGWENIITIK